MWRAKSAEHPFGRTGYPVMIAFCLALTACGGDDGSAGDAPDITLMVTVSGLDEGERLTVVQNDDPLPTPVTADGSFTLQPVRAGSSYSVALKAGWYGDNLETGEYCYVKNGTGTATADVTDIQIECGPAPSQIDLSKDSKVARKKDSLSYLGWFLKYPTVVNGKLYYQVMYDGAPYATDSATGRVSHDQNGYLLTDMSRTLQRLFEASRMGMLGDPGKLQSGMPGCQATCSPNVTTLQTNSMGAISVALPTITQLENIYRAVRVPSGWADLFFWSSTLHSSGYYYYMIPRTGTSSYLPVGAYNYVALQLP